METLKLLSVGLGLAALAGINLYLTVFVTGLAIQQHWVVLSSQFQPLDVLANPAIIAISGALFFLQFFADKVPWVDSLWDSVHTVIRPIGGAFLAVHTLGHTSQAMEVIAALLGGGIALTTHTAKAGARLIANTSPEPFSNIGLSLGEDAAVIGGLALIHLHPFIAFVVFILALAAIYYFAPKLARGIGVKVWLIWRKLKMPAQQTATDTPLPAKLQASIDLIFAHYNLLHEQIVWAVPCISTRSKQIPPNLFGYLIATREEPQKLTFVAKRRFRDITETLDISGYRVSHEPRFLSAWLTLYSLDKRPKYTFIFDRSREALVQQIAETLAAQLQSAAAPAASLPTALNLDAPAR